MSVRALELTQRWGALQGALQQTKVADDMLRRRIFWERVVLLPLLAVVALTFAMVGRVQVTGISMQPQFQNGDKLTFLKAYRWLSPLKPGDIVVINKKYGPYAGIHLIKRIFFIQNAEANAEWPKTVLTSTGPADPLDMFPDYMQKVKFVPRNQILVVGDNFENSEDSRDASIGPIAPDEIMGKVLVH